MQKLQKKKNPLTPPTPLQAPNKQKAIWKYHHANILTTI